MALPVNDDRISIALNTSDVDVLVVGTGVAGALAALAAEQRGLKVLLVEKDSFFGGATGISGGWVWLPGNPLARAAGIDDKRADMVSYIEQESGSRFDPLRVTAFLENVPQVLRFMEQHTAVRLACPPIAPDYHAEWPGGMRGGRSLSTQPLDARVLGEQVRRIRPPLRELSIFGMMLGSGQEVRHFMRATRSFESAGFVLRRFLRHARDLVLFGRGMTLTNGGALSGRLLKSVLDRGIPVWYQSAVRQLVFEDGAVRGAYVERDGQTTRINASHGVILATGGFSRDASRRARLFDHVAQGQQHGSLPPESITGDGIRLAESVGGCMELGFTNPGAWAPVSRVPRPDGSVGLFPHFIDRAKPGVIAVLQDGKRFVNESVSYHEFVQALLRHSRNRKDALCYLVCDHRAIRSYGLGAARPFPVPLSRHLRSGYLVKGASLADLARQIGVDPDGLAETVEEFNRDAAQGTDSRFGKGSRAYGRNLGDPLVTPNPCVAPLANGPYYAVEVGVGDLGTFAGLKTDSRARVLDLDGEPVPGLHAAGNDMASLFGGAYPGAGAMIGPAMTFGYIAGCAIEPVRSKQAEPAMS